MHQKQSDVGALWVPKFIFCIIIKEVLKKKKKSLEFVRGDASSPQPREELPPQVCEVLAVWNFKHCEGTTYTLWFALHSLPGNGVGSDPQASAQVLCSRGRTSPVFLPQVLSMYGVGKAPNSV